MRQPRVVKSLPALKAPGYNRRSAAGRTVPEKAMPFLMTDSGAGESRSVRRTRLGRVPPRSTGLRTRPGRSGRRARRDEHAASRERDRSGSVSAGLGPAPRRARPLQGHRALAEWPSELEAARPARTVRRHAPRAARSPRLARARGVGPRGETPAALECERPLKREEPMVAGRREAARDPRTVPARSTCRSASRLTPREAGTERRREDLRRFPGRAR